MLNRIIFQTILLVDLRLPLSPGEGVGGEVVQPPLAGLLVEELEPLVLLPEEEGLLLLEEGEYVLVLLLEEDVLGAGSIFCLRMFPTRLPLLLLLLYCEEVFELYNVPLVLPVATFVL